MACALGFPAGIKLNHGVAFQQQLLQVPFAA
jgi:hypothetical protein